MSAVCSIATIQEISGYVGKKHLLTAGCLDHSKAPGKVSLQNASGETQRLCNKAQRDYMDK